MLTSRYPAKRWVSAFAVAASIVTMSALFVLPSSLAAGATSEAAWRVIPSPDVSPTQDNVLNAVTCGEFGCVAVGDHWNGTNFQTLAEYSPYSPNGESSWSILRSQNIGSSEDNVLNGVSCWEFPLLKFTCVAVGYYFDPDTGAFQTLTAGWLGEAPVDPKKDAGWSVSPGPDVGSSENNVLNGVSCFFDQTFNPTCLAVGDYLSGGSEHPLVVTVLNNSYPSVFSAPGSGELKSMSCEDDRDSCTAVGDEGGAQTLVENWNGSTVSIVPSPNPPNASDIALNSLSCASSSACTAVGDYSTGASRTGLIETWDGTSWSIAPNVTQPKTSNVTLNAVSCSLIQFTRVSECTVVGDYSTGGNDLTLVESWDGTSWSIVPTPNADPTGNNSLNGVVGVLAVGEYNNGHNDQTLVMSPVHAVESYRLVASDGGVFAFSAAAYHGSMGGKHLNASIVGMAADPAAADPAGPATGGYWLVGSDGGVFSFDAPYLGSMGGKHLSAPIVGIASDPATGGYWLVGSDGGVFAFDAPYLGSMGGKHLNAPIVGIASDPATGGYWLVGSDGGVFAFSASYLGSMGGKRLNAPIVGITADPMTGGYWIAAKDGGVFSFDARYLGSMGGKHLNDPVVGIG